MKTNIEITLTGTEVLSDFFVPEAKKQGFDIPVEQVKIQVFSKGKNEWVDFESDKIIFQWKKT